MWSKIHSTVFGSAYKFEYSKDNPPKSDSPPRFIIQRFLKMSFSPPPRPIAQGSKEYKPYAFKLSNI